MYFWILALYTHTVMLYIFSTYNFDHQKNLNDLIK